MNGYQHNVLSQLIKFSTAFRILWAKKIKIDIFDGRKCILKIWPFVSTKFIFGSLISYKILSRLIHTCNYASAAED